MDVCGRRIALCEAGRPRHRFHAMRFLRSLPGRQAPLTPSPPPDPSPLPDPSPPSQITSYVRQLYPLSLPPQAPSMHLNLTLLRLLNATHGASSASLVPPQGLELQLTQMTLSIEWEAIWELPLLGKHHIGATAKATNTLVAVRSV